jgi:hypothetical protein
MRSRQKLSLNAELRHAKACGEWFDMKDWRVDQWLAARERDSDPRQH